MREQLDDQPWVDPGSGTFGGQVAYSEGYTQKPEGPTKLEIHYQCLELTLEQLNGDGTAVCQLGLDVPAKAATKAHSCIPWGAQSTYN